ncbi:MAG: aldolase [Ruminiclostridium sp.]|nr:aldolase [Ruminiclostridium sp.]
MAGFDFVIIDLEHGPNSVESAQNLIRAACISNTLPIVRVKENNFSIIGEVLDIGAGGIQVPQITCPENAEEVIKFAKFAPSGMRGLCRFVRAAGYSAMDRFDYIQKANEAIVILQLESSESITNIEDILKIDGIDVIFVGPYDLSQSMGVPGQIDNPLVEEKMAEIVDVCSKNGICVGTFVDTLENAKKWKNAGVKYLSYNVDVGIFYEACSSIVKSIKNF